MRVHGVSGAEVNLVVVAGYLSSFLILMPDKKISAVFADLVLVVCGGSETDQMFGSHVTNGHQNNRERR